MHYLQIALLAVVQGLAELLPVSSSAHVIVAEKLMGLDPSSPEMTFVLVMLHTGTMFAVLLYFWPAWRQLLFGAPSGKEPLVATTAKGERRAFLGGIVLATACTGVLGYGLKTLIENFLMAGIAHAEIESLFGNLPLIGAALAAVGVLIIYAGRQAPAVAAAPTSLASRSALMIGLMQGLCLPFRGFSRSGATISVGLMRGVPRAQAESFSFALAVVLTPPVIAREVLRLLKAAKLHPEDALSAAVFAPGIVGMVFSFGAGLLALRWVSAWLEKGRWSYFGYYCLAFAGVVLALSQFGY